MKRSGYRLRFAWLPQSHFVSASHRIGMNSSTLTLKMYPELFEQEN